jgi:hypothetical protein
MLGAVGRGLQPEDAVEVFARSCGPVCNKPPPHSRQKLSVLARRTKTKKREESSVGAASRVILRCTHPRRGAPLLRLHAPEARRSTRRGWPLPAPAGRRLSRAGAGARALPLRACGVRARARRRLACAPALPLGARGRIRTVPRARARVGPWTSTAALFGKCRQGGAGASPGRAAGARRR